jgi:hypothetical protein
MNSNKILEETPMPYEATQRQNAWAAFSSAPDEKRMGDRATLALQSR